MVVDGRKIAEEILKKLQKRPRPKGKFVAVLVGKDPASISFVRQKQIAAKRLGVDFFIKNYPGKILQQELEMEIKKFSRKKDVAGIIVQLPLPKHIFCQKILDCILIQKDVDLLSSAAFGKFATKESKIIPPVVAAIAKILQKYRIQIRGKNATVVGAGKLVGLPAAIWFAQQGATVSLLNQWSKNLSLFTKTADIIVCGVGKPNLIKGKMIKKGAIVFDAGYSLVGGKIFGDCDFKSVSKKAKLITPVPGGIGPLTVAMLFKNFYDLNRARNR